MIFTEKGEYSKLYDYLKSKKVKVTTSGKMEGGNLKWDDQIDDKGKLMIIIGIHPHTYTHK